MSWFLLRRKHGQRNGRTVSRSASCVCPCWLRRPVGALCASCWLLVRPRMLRRRKCRFNCPTVPSQRQCVALSFPRASTERGAPAGAMRSSPDETRPGLCPPPLSGVCGDFARRTGVVRECRWLLPVRRGGQPAHGVLPAAEGSTLLRLSGFHRGGGADVGLGRASGR